MVVCCRVTGLTRARARSQRRSAPHPRGARGAAVVVRNPPPRSRARPHTPPLPPAPPPCRASRACWPSWATSCPRPPSPWRRTSCAPAWATWCTRVRPSVRRPGVAAAAACSDGACTERRMKQPRASRRRPASSTGFRVLHPPPPTRTSPRSRAAAAMSPWRSHAPPLLTLCAKPGRVPLSIPPRSGVAAGHLPQPAEGPLIVGKVGSELTTEQGYEASRAVILNILATLKGAWLGRARLFLRARRRGSVAGWGGAGGRRPPPLSSFTGFAGAPVPRAAPHQDRAPQWNRGAPHGFWCWERSG